MSRISGGTDSSDTIAAGLFDAPNLIVIMADDLAYFDLGCYGGTEPITPNIDALATAGMRFTDHYTAPACTPTRFMLNSGLHIQRSQELWGAITIGQETKGLQMNARTLAWHLQRKGYTTGAIGKWHLGHGKMLSTDPATPGPDVGYHPMSLGFDSFYGCLLGAGNYNTHWYYDQAADWWDGREYDLEEVTADKQVGTYATWKFRDKALEFLSAHGGRRTPYYLYLPFTAPHWAATSIEDSASENMQLPPGEDVERTYLSKFDHLGLSDSDVRKRYLAMMNILDEAIGDIVHAVENAGDASRTIILFLSDNGGDDPQFGADNGIFNGRKTTSYEGGIRTPAIVRWDGNVPANVASDQLVQVTDWPVTLSTLMGYAMSGTDGLDLSPVLEGGAVIDRDIWFDNEFYGKVFRRGDYKYLLPDGGSDELYDLASDPGETTNLAATETAKLTELKTAHADYATSKGF